MSNRSRVFLIIAIGIFIIVAAFGRRLGYLDTFLHLPSLSSLQTSGNTSGASSQPQGEKIKIVSEESVVIDVAEKVSPSVVTIGVKRSNLVNDCTTLDCFYKPSIQEKTTEQDIGSGFIISSDGLIVTNRHVVDVTQGIYRVVTKDNITHEVVKIYRDRLNDIAIMKINATGLRPVELGDSDKIKVGQLAIAIGTALGEFRHTVTTGVVSGLGRGISAGSPFEGFVERLDDLIQTSAAINPGNSGGPLLNSSGQVIGINTAVSQDGQNIGFAIPINVVKEAIDNFNKTGQFSRPFLGVRYRMIDQKTALLNDVPSGALVQEVVAGSAAEKGGVKVADIITKIDGKKVTGDETSLAKEIGAHKVGDKMSLEVWRDEVSKTLSITLEEAK